MGTQVFGGIFTLPAAYYLARYAPTLAQALRCPATSLLVCSLETVQGTGQWEFMDVSPKFETVAYLNYGRNMLNVTDNSEGVPRTTLERYGGIFSRQFTLDTSILWRCYHYAMVRVA